MVNIQIFRNSFNLKYLTQLHQEFLNFSNGSDLIEQAIALEKFLLQKIGLPLSKTNINIIDKFKAKKLDYENLCERNISLEPAENLGNFNFRKQDLTEKANLHVNYCLKCHERGKDSCRKGLQKENKFMQNPLSNVLHGCPLDMHISEAILLKEQNHTLAALAMMMINNPLLALTGHRICNDCSKACIFQKQTQVDVPVIESKIFEDILALPYGVEIYILLTQWNPLNISAPLPLGFNKKHTLIIGAGPAGISLSYYLLRAGWAVNLIEANQIHTLKNKHRLLKSLLNNRLIDGFGGVASYGITSRWNKNYLTILRLVLERNRNYKYQDGIRFGSNYTAQEALQDGFDHIVLTTGASLQKIPEIKNLLGENIRFSADFLMNLQLGGAYKKDSLTNLKINLPAIVIGGGLTAIDAATELVHYYFHRMEKIVNPSERYKLMEQLGGVKIIYHNKLNQSAAYKTNYEEIEAALKIGIKFCEDIKIIEIKKDPSDDSYLVLTEDGNQLKARTILIATGMGFNPLILQETEIINDQDIEKFMSQASDSLKDNRKTNFIWQDRISLVGDANPFYQGSVVKAILNAKVAAQEINNINITSKYRKASYRQSTSHIISIKKIANHCLLILHSPAAQKFQPGEFFKIQNQKSEPVALTPIYIDHAKSEIHFLIEIKGASTRSLFQMRPKEKIICMGPVGAPFTTPLNKKILIHYGQGLALYALLPLIQKLKQNHCQITLMVNGFNISFNFYNKIIRTYIDHIISSEPSDYDQYDYIFTNANIKDKDKVIKFMNAPMQCMMKGICAQCIRRDRDGQYYYSCARSLFNLESKI